MRRNVATVKHRWIKNPFNSMYFAVQAMAADNRTLVMYQIQKSGKKIISMLSEAM
jgi:hypothetical protein